MTGALGANWAKYTDYDKFLEIKQRHNLKWFEKIQHIISSAILTKSLDTMIQRMGNDSPTSSMGKVVSRVSLYWTSRSEVIESMKPNISDKEGRHFQNTTMKNGICLEHLFVLLTYS